MSFYGHKKQESSYGGGSWSLPPLPIQQTLMLHLNFALRGAQDAIKLQVAGEKLSIDKVAQANVLKSTLLQGIVLASALVIKPILKRAVGVVDGSSTRGVTSSILYILFHVFWLYPVAAIATYYSGLLRPSPESARRGMASRPATVNGGMVAKLVAESYRTLVTLNYFAFFFALKTIPLVGGFLAFLYACIVDAYYCFEQHWLRNGWPFDDRVRHVEQRWAYALGFGFPITFLSWWSSDPVVNLALFALAYPLFQLTSTVSIPQPLDPSLPSTSSTAASFLNATASSATPAAGASFSIAAAEGGSEDRGRKGSPFVPERMRVLVLADLGYKSLRAAFGGAGGGAGGSGGRKKDAAGFGHGGGTRSAFNSPGRYGANASANPAGIDPYGGGGGAYASQSPAAASSAYGSAYASTTSSASDPYGTSAHTPYAGQAPMATPPRRGHAMNDSADVSSSPYGNSSPYSRNANVSGMGYGGDRHLDGLLRAAGGRKKGD